VSIDAAKPRARYDVGVLHKTLDVLESLADGRPLTAMECAERTRISKTAAYRILGTLEGRGYVVRDDATRRFAIGVNLLALGRAVLASADLVGVARRAMRALRDEFGETVNLGALSLGRVVYLEMLESERGLRTTVDVGSFDHLHTTALGRAILASLPAEEARAIVETIDLVAVTPRSPIELEVVLAELEHTSERGYAVDDEENEIGVRCVGVPIHDEQGRAIAALSISGPVSRIEPALVPRLAASLLEAARQVERATGVFDA
jgi:IclR family transcriptional regulator, acetate operon repressor